MYCRGVTNDTTFLSPVGGNGKNGIYGVFKHKSVCFMIGNHVSPVPQLLLRVYE